MFSFKYQLQMNLKELVNIISVLLGVETTVSPQEFIQGGNQMDLIITPSEFTKETLIKTVFTQIDKKLNKKLVN